MSGPNARYALPEDERAPIDQNPGEPEPGLSSTAAPTTAPGGDEAHRAERPEAMLPDRPLGPPLPAAVELDAAAICRHFGELAAVLPEVIFGIAEHKRGLVTSGFARIETLAGHARKLLESRR